MVLTWPGLQLKLACSFCLVPVLPSACCIAPVLLQVTSPLRRFGTEMFLILAPGGATPCSCSRSSTRLWQPKQRTWRSCCGWGD